MHTIYFRVMCAGSIFVEGVGRPKGRSYVTQRRKEIKTNQTYLLFIKDNNAHYLIQSDVRGFPFG